MQPDRAELARLYEVERLSPETIGQRFGRTGRTVRSWMEACGIPRRGAQHLRTGKPATWNIGRKHSPEHRAANGAARRGKIPHNKGRGRIERQCRTCGSFFSDKPYRRSAFCGRDCRDQWSTLSRGEFHWNFKGSEAGFRQKQRYWAEYRQWRCAVMARDSFTCTRCRLRGGCLTAHHLNSWAAFPAQRFDVENGATLCWRCHWSFHRAYGHKRSSKDQFKEWLTTPLELPSAK